MTEENEEFETTTTPELEGHDTEDAAEAETVTETALAPRRGATLTKEIIQTVEDDERTGKFEELLDIEKEIDSVIDEKAGFNQEKNAELKGLRAKRKSLMDTIDSGTERVEIECYEVFNDQLQEVQLFRADNDEQLVEHTRPMTAAERQAELPYAEEDANEDADLEDEENAEAVLDSLLEIRKMARAGQAGSEDEAPESEPAPVAASSTDGEAAQL